MRDDPEAGLAHMDAVLEHGELANYYLAHSARADMYRRLGRTAEARASYEKALALSQQEPERRFLAEAARGIEIKIVRLSRFFPSRFFLPGRGWPFEVCAVARRLVGCRFRRAEGAGGAAPGPSVWILDRPALRTRTSAGGRARQFSWRCACARGDENGRGAVCGTLGVGSGCRLPAAVGICLRR